MVAANILIAVGTTPSRPHGVDSDGRTITTSDTVLNLEHLPRTMVVVGAGVIGIEYASMFAALGVQVTVIDGRPRPLEFLDHEIVDELIHQMRKSDVVFRCGDAVEKIEVVGDIGHRQGLLSLASGKHLVADVVLFSAGRIGATADLNLEAAGLTADDRGRLQVDDHYRTVVSAHLRGWRCDRIPGPGGDVERTGTIWRRAGCSASMPNRWATISLSASTRFLKCSMAGATEEELTRQKIPYETGIARYKEISRGSIRGDDQACSRCCFTGEDGRLLGCHCIGSGATELIHVGQAVLALGGGLDYFLTTVFNYPTLAECYKVAAHNAANKLALVRHATAAVSTVPACKAPTPPEVAGATPHTVSV